MRQRLMDKREATLVRVLPMLECDNVFTDMVDFMMDKDTQGYYSSSTKGIVVRKNLFGINLVDTLFHEDRHYQQHMKNKDFMVGYIRHEDDKLGYMLQHIEKDARRYAFVQTIKAIKSSNNYSIVKWLGCYVATKLAHPFTGMYSTNRKDYSK